MLSRLLKFAKVWYFKLTIRRITSNLKKIGKQVEFSEHIRISFPEKLEIGDYVYIGPNAYLHALGGISIESGAIIGPNITIHSANHNFKRSTSIPYDETFEFRKVKIGENVWIGGNVMIVPGAEIGEGCIIGAGSVVSGKIPPLAIVVGNPAKVIKYRDAEHYYELKKENKIYLKLKNEGIISPNYTEEQIA